MGGVDYTNLPFCISQNMPVTLVQSFRLIAQKTGGGVDYTNFLDVDGRTDSHTGRGKT